MEKEAIKDTIVKKDAGDWACVRKLKVWSSIWSKCGFIPVYLATIPSINEYDYPYFVAVIIVPEKVKCKKCRTARSNIDYINEFDY